MRNHKEKKFYNIKKQHEIFVLLFIGLITGATTGLVGYVFGISINKIHNLKEYIITNTSTDNIIIKIIISIIISIFLIIMSLLITKKVSPETKGSGIPQIEGAMEHKMPILWKRSLPTKFITGVLSLSSGLVIGKAGPILYMGSAIGKMYSCILKLNNERTHIFIASGAAAGISASFNAPITGVLFVIEAMRAHFKFKFLSLQCIIISSISSNVISRIFLGQKSLIQIPKIHTIPISNLWCFIIFGILFGIMGVVFNKYFIFFIDFFKNMKTKSYWTSVTIIATAFGIISITYPYITGAGYNIIYTSIFDHIPIWIIIFIFILRFFTTLISNGLGICGGFFEPMLALGTVFGIIFDHVSHEFFPLISISTPPMAFALAGMSSLFCATVGAPITGIILVVELTHNYDLLLPMIISALFASVTSYLMGGQPIYETLLKRYLKN